MVFVCIRPILAHDIPYMFPHIFPRFFSYFYYLYIYLSLFSQIPFLIKFLSHMLHVWYMYLDFGDFLGQMLVNTVNHTWSGNEIPRFPRLCLALPQVKSPSSSVPTPTSQRPPLMPPVPGTMPEDLSPLRVEQRPADP